MPAAQRIEPERKVGPGLTFAANGVALAEQRGEIGRRSGEPQTPRPEQHVRESRVNRELRHAAAMRGDSAGSIERTELAEQFPGLLKRGGRRGIQPLELAWIG